jgi:hypothetical protein
MRDANLMSAAATKLLETLDPAQVRTVCFEPTDDVTRTDWDYRPRRGPGLSIGEMTPGQQAAARALVSSGTALAGYARVWSIVALEAVLARLEPGRSDRDPNAYAITIFGDPTDAAWAWRFQGHHVSLNVTIVDGRVAAAPSFLGANPETVRGDEGIVSRPLAEEDDLGRAIVRSLDGRGRGRAVVSDQAPSDILTSNDARVVDPPVHGIPVMDMPPSSRMLVSQLLRAYATRLPEGLAARELERLDASDGAALHFAWAGGIEPGEGHYYRLAGRRLLIEADCTQDGANHIHTVWRDPQGDFGRDLLREHLDANHRGETASTA